MVRRGIDVGGQAEWLAEVSHVSTRRVSSRSCPSRVNGERAECRIGGVQSHHWVDFKNQISGRVHLDENNRFVSGRAEERARH